MNAERLERFSRGEHFAVDPEAIERELATLWREAGASSGNPVTRACLWNVVFLIEKRSGADGCRHFDHLMAVIRELPRHLANRSLVLQTSDPGDPELECWISANCIPAGNGAKLVCSEEITLASRGLGHRHLPGLSRALLVPAVPTAVVSASAPDPSCEPLAELIRMADRVITDADRSHRDRPLDEVARVNASAPLGAMDVGWLSTEAFRREVASIFDPPLPVPSLDGIRRIQVEAPADQRSTGLLLLAWAANALGATEVVASNEQEWIVERRQGVRLHLGLTQAKGPNIRFEHRYLPDPLGVRSEPDALWVDLPGRDPLRKPMRPPSTAELLARALITRREDPLFTRALLLAGRLR